MKIELHRILLLAAFFLGSVKGAGNEEDVLDENVGTLYQQAPNTTKFYCTFRNLWTKERQPKKYPDPLARWAGPLLYTHTTQFEPWAFGFPCTRGVEKLAEDGFTDHLTTEMEQQGSQVFRWSEPSGGSFFTNQRDFIHIPPVEANFDFPYLSMIAGMGPSPDWYTGFYTFWLIDEYSRTWYDHLKIQTKPWDAGTDAGTTYTAVDADMDPAMPVERMIPRTAPQGGELWDPTGSFIPNVGELECYLIVGDEDYILPDCDYFQDPCCNETSSDCDNKLPYDREPTLSPEYRQVLENSQTTLVHMDGLSAAPSLMKVSLVTLGVGFLVQWLMMV